MLYIPSLLPLFTVSPRPFPFKVLLPANYSTPITAETGKNDLRNLGRGCRLANSSLSKLPAVMFSYFLCFPLWMTGPIV
jgi:hypothetical protein